MASCIIGLGFANIEDDINKHGIGKHCGIIVGVTEFRNSSSNGAEKRGFTISKPDVAESFAISIVPLLNNVSRVIIICD